MKLWLLRRADPPTWGGYDMSYGHVVRAETEERARQVAYNNAGDEGGGTWQDPTMTTCVELTKKGAEECILTDYLAG